MSVPGAAAAVDLMPAVRQRHWGAPAVVNFWLGGLGAGHYAVAAAAARLEADAGPGPAAWLGPLLVLAGLAAVALEAGRPLRGVRVLARPATSWMSREAWLAGAFVLAAAAAGVTALGALEALAAVLGLAFATSQGFLVRRARAVAAWDVSLMPALFAASALVSGLGAHLVVGVLRGRAPGDALLGVALLGLAVGLLVWLHYATWSDEPAFVRSTRALRLGWPGLVIVAGGYAVPFALAALAQFAGHASALALAAGVAIVAGQGYAKWVLIREVGELRPVTLAGLTVRRRER
jgi:phenylacetyl-CoA:acceptor oxidoreductase subunit 2